ncbi:ribonuclease HII [Bacillus sp. Marseille-P3661]|uniref:ribonuclease HII n=1 Tax=Bacillus sp. Marseille-P3661 TaxID=1936234 RepID=UPI000C81E33C|nr:ribonuclease HII [Bacillus sp. Marseille-P3661]
MEKTIKEIEELLSKSTTIDEDLLHKLKSDHRKGVQLLVKRWLKNKIAQQQLHEQFNAMSFYEKELYKNNIYYVAGVDEVGRGPLAGPVVASAVILGEDFYLPGLNDSKALSETKREELYKIIIEKAISVGIGFASVNEIDTVNIYEATKLAMKRAIESLAIQPEYILADAMEIPIAIPQKSIIKGDSKSISIAASSIIAKVTRDRYMKELGTKYPGYGFEKHMGYGTAAHLEAIEKLGIIEEHRCSFAPIKQHTIVS